MALVTFGELAIGDKFWHEGCHWQKIEEKKDMHGEPYNARHYAGHLNSDLINKRFFTDDRYVKVVEDKSVDDSSSNIALV